MRVREHVPLSTLTTLRVGGDARYVIDCVSAEDVRAALSFAREQALPHYVLGEGSNVLAPDEGFAGVVVRMLMPGISFDEQADAVELTLGAGVSWDEAVRAACARGLWGIENLAGIPGTAGAAPVQNIGAYGTELRDTLVRVEALQAETGAGMTLSAAECELGYRDSRFKHDASLIITSITLALSRTGAANSVYGDLARARDAGADFSTPEKVADAVRAIRAGKFPDRTVYGTAGSFFKNPILSEEAYEALSKVYGSVPRFSNPNGVKIPLAFILDTVLGLRGYRKGPAWLFGAQPLVLVLDAGAQARDVDALANEIAARVKEATTISIEREVRTLRAEKK